jgi:hypothetical protein
MKDDALDLWELNEISGISLCNNLNPKAGTEEGRWNNSVHHTYLPECLTRDQPTEVPPSGHQAIIKLNIHHPKYRQARK